MHISPIFDKNTQPFHLTLGTFVFEETYDPDDAGQMWEKGVPNSQGFFTLKNPASGKFLIAESEDRLSVKGNDILKH